MTDRKRVQVAVCSPSFSKNPILREEMERAFPGTLFNDTGTHYCRQELIERLRPCDGIIGSLESIDCEVLQSLPKLRVISKYGVGIDNIDLEACEKSSVKVCYTPGVNRKSVAEMVLFMMIGFSRGLFFTSGLLKKGIWKKDGGHDLNSNTIGIIGVGNIGKELIRLLEPFDCRILVNDIIDQTRYYHQHFVTEASKDEIFRYCDVVTIHTPLTEKTRYMVDMERLKMMKKTGFIINSARGGIIKQDHLKEALKRSMIAGAALDVFESEPPEDMEFLALPNLIPTPHVGGNSFESVISMGRSAIRHLEDFFYG